MPRVELGRRIAAVRAAAGLTQQQLADKLGVSFQAVSRWENGLTSPRNRNNLKQLAELGRTTVDWILYGVDETGADVSLPPVAEVGRAVPSISPEDVARHVSGDRAVEQRYTTHFSCGPNSFRTFIRDTAMGDELRVGDSIIVDPDEPPRPDDFVLILHKGLPTVRVFHENGDHVDLEPLNQSHTRYRDLDDTRFEEIFLGTIVEHARARRP